MKPLFILFFLGLSQIAFANTEIVELKTPFVGSSLFKPAHSEGELPGIIIFHGSEGGMNGRMRNQARVIARKGYVALSYCYFDCQRTAGDNAEELHEANLNESYRAFQWLKKLTSGKVGIYGVSRGAEKALLLTSLMVRDQLELPDAVGVHAPSDFVVVGFNPNWNLHNRWMCWEEKDVKWDQTCGTPPPKNLEDLKGFPAWSYNGSTAGLIHESDIAIEKYLGPVFVTHGEKDGVWEVERSRRIKAKILKARDTNGGILPEVHFFPNQGHRLDDRNESRRWKLLFDFFERNLK